MTVTTIVSTSATVIDAGGPLKLTLVSGNTAAGVLAEKTQQAIDAIGSAANTAMFTASMYPDTSTGLLSTTPGDYFSIPSPDAAEFSILYLNSSGVAVEQKRFPTAGVTQAAIDASVVSQAAADFAFDTVQAFADVSIYQTKAEANAEVAWLADLSLVMVLIDESMAGIKSLYRKESGSLVFRQEQLTKAVVDAAVIDAEAAAVAAETARDAAQLSKGLFQTTAQGIGNGVAGVASLVGGSGGANGTFALAFSGGTQVIAPKGYFVVAGGVVTQAVITYSGYYSAGAPTISFAASSGLTGASATAVMAVNSPVGTYFSVPVSAGNDAQILYRVDAGPVATEITRYSSSSAVAQALNATSELREELALAGAEIYTGAGDIHPIAVDKNGRIILGYDNVEKRLVGSFTSTQSDSMLLAPLAGLTRISGKAVVIAGDSLSYNPHGFVTVTNQANEAPPGVGSWPYLLRDAIHRNDPYFKHADEIEITDNASGALLSMNPSATKYKLPFNGIAAYFQPTAPTDYAEFSYAHMGSASTIYIHTLLTSDSKDCTFDVHVNGVLKVTGYTTIPTTGYYAGLTPAAITVPGVPNTGVAATIKITNTTKNGSNTTSGVYICGVSSKYTPIDLTGYGGQASDWLLANINPRILNYSPSLLFCIIGANDNYKGLTAAQSESNIRAIVAACRVSNPLMHIVFLSPPLSNEALTPNSFMIDVHNRMRQVCAETGCYFFSVQGLFDRVSIGDYRYDSVHFSKNGNGMIAKDLIEKVLGASVFSPELIDPNTNYYAGVVR